MRSRAAGWVAAAIVATALAACGGGTTEANAYAWKAASHDAATLTLIVVTGPDDKAVAGELIFESDNEVVVAAKVQLAGGSQPGNGVFREVDVDLGAPVGDRQVANRDGSIVPEQK